MRWQESDQLGERPARQSEAEILKDVAKAAAKLGYRLSRNNLGQYFKDGYFIRYGCFNPGGGDLIGWRTVTITPDMVGRRVAQFVSVECKTAKGRQSPKQAQFAYEVAKAGGVAILARSVDDLLGTSPHVT